MSTETMLKTTVIKGTGSIIKPNGGDINPYEGDISGDGGSSFIVEIPGG